MSFWTALRDKFREDKTFRNRVLTATAVALGAGTVYYYGRKHGAAKVEKKFESYAMLEEHEDE